MIRNPRGRRCAPIALTYVSTVPSTDRDKWSERYREKPAPSPPSPFFAALDTVLPRLVRGLAVLRSEEGWLESGRHEARMMAYKPEEDRT